MSKNKTAIISIVLIFLSLGVYPISNGFSHNISYSTVSNEYFFKAVNDYNSLPKLLASDSNHYNFSKSENNNGNKCENNSSMDLIIGGGGGGTSNNYVYIKLYIFGGLGNIIINGVKYSNDKTVALIGGSKNNIGADPSTGCNFVRWIADSGSISNESSPSTYYIAPNSNSGGSLTMVIKYNNYCNNWAAMIESGTSFSEASATIQLPSCVGYSQWENPIGTINWGAPSVETVVMWVGLGGFNNCSLWQAGIGIQYNSSTNNGNPPWIYAFYEYVSNNQNSTINIHPIYGYKIPFGSTVRVSVSYAIIGSEYGWENQMGYYSFSDCLGSLSGSVRLGFFDPLNHGNSFTFFNPAPTTAEWIVEDPTDNLFIMPYFSQADFFSMNAMYNGNNAYNYIYSPIGISSVDAHRYSYLTINLHQYLTTSLDNNLINGFDVTYRDQLVNWL